MKRFKLKKKKGLGNFVHSHIFQSIYKIRKTPYVGDSVDALRRYLRVFVGICLLFIDTKLDWDKYFYPSSSLNRMSGSKRVEVK